MNRVYLLIYNDTIYSKLVRESGSLTQVTERKLSRRIFSACTNKCTFYFEKIIKSHLNFNNLYPIFYETNTLFTFVWVGLKFIIIFWYTTKYNFQEIDAQCWNLNRFLNMFLKKCMWVNIFTEQFWLHTAQITCNALFWLYYIAYALALHEAKLLC